MKAKLILHIGHGKTGTSFIQSVLASNTDYLKSRGIHYPEHVSFDHAREGRVSSGNGSLLHEGKISVRDKTLLSNEGFFHALSSDEKLEELVLSHGADVHVLLYSRNVFEMVTSTWGQRVKRADETHNIDKYMLRLNDPHHRRTLWWLEASKRLGFACTVRNYSNHRKQLIDTFLADVTGEDGVDFSSQLLLPKNTEVNRSLTLSEYKIQREFNKSLLHTGRYVSDTFVNRLPSIQSETPLIRRETHDKVKEWIQPTIDQINELIDPEEALRVETYEEIQAKSVELKNNEYRLSGEQIEVLIAVVAEKISGTQSRRGQPAKHQGSVEGREKWWARYPDVFR